MRKQHIKEKCVYRKSKLNQLTKKQRLEKQIQHLKVNWIQICTQA